MSNIEYDFSRQRIVRRNQSGKLISLYPIYNEDMNRYNEFFQMIQELKLLSGEFPQQKIIVEMQNVPSDQYENIKDLISIGEAFTDHIAKFFYQVNINCVIIVHEIY